jgi:predicted nucleic acid-binding protein
VTARVFLDTNILVYADDLDAGPKRRVATELITKAIVDRNGVLSTQILQEFFVVATRKLGVKPEVARRKVELLSTLDVVRIQVGDVLEAIDLHRLHKLSFWDSLVLRCAIVAGCERLLSEDLQHGRIIGGVRIENPFAGKSEHRR